MIRGVLFIATGHKKYVEQAAISKRSIKRFHPDLKVGIYTNIDDLEGWDIIVKAEKNPHNTGQMFTTKIDGIINTPFDQTLYLDTDIFALNKFEQIFSLLDKNDLVYTQSHFSNKKRAVFRGEIPEFGKKKVFFDENFPDSFYPIQGGFFLYRKSSIELFKKTKAKYLEKQWWDDQPTIMECLWNSSLKTYVLPRSYNFCDLSDWILWRHKNFQDLSPQFWHYTFHKKYLKEKDFYKIEKTINNGNKLMILVLWLKLKLLNKA